MSLFEFMIAKVRGHLQGKRKITRLRNLLSEENLESYALLSIEKEFLYELDAERIIGRFGQSSSEHKRLLLVLSYCSYHNVW